MAVIPALAELKALDQWVLWKQETRDGKSTKVPYRADGRGRAASTDSATWSTHKAAEAARADAAGLGFVLTPDDPYCCIDLDDCRDAVTGVIEPWAQAIMDRFRSYTELSPSGTGVHIWIKGRKPGGRCRVDGVEIYSEARYVTVTGQVLEPPT